MSAPVALCPPSVSQRPGTMAEKYGPHTPGMNFGSRDTARVQEMHILAGHMLCDWLEADWVATEAEAAKGVTA